MMEATYECPGCGLRLPEGQAASTANVAPCPKCGRDMYRQAPAAAVPSRYGGGPAASSGGVVGRAAPAVPSRYGATAGAERFIRRDEDDDANPVVLPHTPFVVILGFILSFVPLLCFAGAIISYLGYRLVLDSPKGIRGKELAIAGMVLGGLMSLLSLYLLMNRA